MLSRLAHPLDKRPFLLFALAILAGLFAFIGKEQILRQRRFGVVVAPRHAHLDLSDVGRQQDGEPDGRRQEAPLGARRVRRRIVARRTARAFLGRLFHVGLKFLLDGRIILARLGSILGKRIVRGGEKAGEVPTRRVLVQPFPCEIGILRTWSDEIAAESGHDGRTDVERSDWRGHERFDPSESTISFSACTSQAAV